MKRILILLVCLLWIPAYGQEYLTPYLLIAVENNPGLKAKFNTYLSAMEKIPQAKALPDPTVAFGIFAQPVETRVGPQRLSVAVHQTFPWFGTLKKQGKVAATRAEIHLKDFEQAKIALYKKVKVTYNELYYLNRSIQLTEENLALVNSFKELARVNFESGKTGFVNVIRVEMEERELMVKKTSLVDLRNARRVEFEGLLNQKISDPIEFPETLMVSSLPEEKQILFDSIQTNNLALEKLRVQSKAEEESYELAQLKGRPSLSLGASYINIGSRDEANLTGNGSDAWLLPQVGFSLPIYRKKYKSMAKEASLNKEAIAYQMEERTNGLRSQFENQLTRQIDALRRLELNQSLYDLAQRSLDLLQTEFTTGKTDFEEVLRMQRKLLTYRLGIERARVDNNNAIYEIELLIGR